MAGLILACCRMLPDAQALVYGVTAELFVDTVHGPN